MKKILFGILLAAILSACQTVPYSIKTYPANDFLDYQPKSPIPIDDYSAIKGSEVENYLNNQSSYVVIERIDADGKLSYSDASLSGEIGSYKVIMDYCIYTILPVKNDEVVIGYKKIGVGIRVTAAITTTKANVNLGSLLAIGLGAKTGSLNGALLVDVIGITSNDVTNLVPLTADIDQTSIQTVLQAVAAIKSKIHDEKTTLYPQIIAVKQLEKGNIESINKDEYNRGIKEGSILMGKMRKILSYLSQSVDQVKEWNSMVDLISCVNKDKLKLLTTIKDIEDYLKFDATIKGEIINAVYNEVLRRP